MDSRRFDAITRTLSSRRTTLTGILGGLAAVVGLSFPNEAAAHNLVPSCKKIKDAKKRRACLRRAKAHNRKHRSCVSQPVTTTCAGRCGVYPNNCGQQVGCPCPPGKSCLVNGSCVRTCPPGPCPVDCGCSSPNTEGTVSCIADLTACPTQPSCSSTLDCPLGSHCQPCGPATVCVPLCAA